MAPGINKNQIHSSGNTINSSSHGPKDPPADIKCHMMAPSHICTSVLTVSVLKNNYFNLCREN